MDIRDRRRVKAMAAASLQEALPDYRKLVLFHSLIVMGVSLAQTLLTMLLDYAIEGTGGLAGMGTRSLLTALQSFLSLALSTGLIFWELGILWTAIRTARCQKTSFSMLTRGFRRYGPILRYYLLLFAVLFALALLCSNLGSVLIFFLPMSDEVVQVLSATQTSAQIDQAQLEVLMAYMAPSLIVTMVLYVACMIHLGYRIYFAPYLLLDEVKVGAFQAVRLSNYMTKGSKWALFRLELSLWWYYALQGVLTVIFFGDQFLPGGQVTRWVCYGVYLAGTLALNWFAAPYIHTVYATAYNLLRVKILPSQPPARH